MISGYAVAGLLLMNNWAVVAASHRPLDEAVSAMDVAKQDYSPLGGVAFAALGLLLASAWAWTALSKRFSTDPWIASALFSLILVLGAPAYFFASFANMNSVGDTFADWDAEAAAALELPLYLLSIGAMVLLFMLLAMPLFRAIIRGCSRSRRASS
ncbi:hypothetical protein [Glutamicibacter halophytocola]|nr:hypothetical protein [Glutamicibacter halophytocola]UUX58909.1 hypothetical protein NUH22_16705 [Glutamicibacter halophytocola]